MTLKLHNTLSGTKEAFEPLKAGHAGMYTCGPTVWNYAHVGNLRAFSSTTSPAATCRSAVMT